jgi:hypothetical protein
MKEIKLVPHTNLNKKHNPYPNTQTNHNPQSKPLLCPYPHLNPIPVPNSNPYPNPWPNQKAKRQLEVEKADLTAQMARMESRVKLHTWKVGIKKRLLELKLQHEQV